MRWWTTAGFLIPVLPAVAAVGLAPALLHTGAGRSAPLLVAESLQGNQPFPGPVAPQMTGQRPTFRTAANFVLVDVHPTLNGKPSTDLRVEEFEVLEDGVPQTIATFERVSRTATRAPSPHETPPRSAAGAPTPLGGRRVFVLFLDTAHIGMGSAYRAKGPLARMLDGLMAADDVVAVMTPEMTPGDLTFVTKGDSVAGQLDRWWAWARRDYRTLSGLDATERMYAACYPPAGPNRSLSEKAAAMIERRREKRTLDALATLVAHLPDQQDGRKAVLLVSEGWRLFKADRSLADLDRPPEAPRVFVGPGGKLASGTDARTGNAATPECDRDRQALAELDNAREFRRLMDDGNRANVTFYAIDPRGLPAFDTDLGPDAAIMPRDPKASILAADQDVLRDRVESLQTLAATTDGLAVVNRNDLDPAIARIVEDMNDYYLLGYYSTHAEADGKYHGISVRVRRPGVTVRARRGYRSPTAEELALRVAPADARGSGPSPAAKAIASLSQIRTDAALRVRAGYAWNLPDQSTTPASGATPWIVAELDEALLRQADRQRGASVAVTIADANGGIVASATGTIPPKSRSVLLGLSAAKALEPGEYIVRVSSLSQSGGEASLEASARLTIPPGGAAAEVAAGSARLFRRGPFTGAGFVPTADPRFRRQETLRIELPTAVRVQGAVARLLDRTGSPLAVPVDVRWSEEGAESAVIADLALAPLAAGDYVIELVAGTAASSRPAFVPFRIVP